MLSDEKSDVIKLINLLGKLSLSFCYSGLFLLSGFVWCVSDYLIEKQKQLIETRIKEKSLLCFLAV
jgi:hypothetical protein